jgi:hypothetical protein
VLQIAHPAIGQKRHEAVLRAAHAVDGGDFQAAEAGRGVFLHLRGERVGVADVAEPPPARPRLVIAGDRRPGKLRRRGGGQGQDEGKQQQRQNGAVSHGVANQ